MKKCELFFGRMQPIHSGHAKIIQGMKNPVVVIVKGAKSSQDKKRNPLDAEYQKKLLKKVAPNAKVLEFGSGYLPDIVEHVRKTLKMDPNVVYSGPDRIGKYRGQVASANKSLPEDQKIHIQFKEAERVTSATVVREAIRSGDEKAFRANVPQSIWDEFNKLQKLLEDTMDNTEFQVLSFKEWLEEEKVRASAQKAPAEKQDVIPEPAELAHDEGDSTSGDDGGKRMDKANNLKGGEKAHKVTEPKEHKIDAGKGPETANKVNNGQKAIGG